jgi:hypothetical protein
MKCERELLGICFVTPSNSPTIFGFSEFISALALLLVVYTITDVRFRFRVAIAPQPVFSITFWLMGFIGAAILLTDVWVTEHWLAPTWMSQSVWRGILGAYFLLLPMTWLYYGYIRPPVFGTANYRKFIKELYGSILGGSDAELPVIANELARSAPALVTFCRPIKRKWEENEQKSAQKPLEPDAGTYAYDLILLLANRKLCRHIVASSPITAMWHFLTR